MVIGLLHSKNKTRLVNLSVVLGIFVLGIVLSVAGCIEVSPSQVTMTPPKIVVSPPDPAITSTNVRTSVEGLHYYTYVDVSVHNYGGKGTVVVWTTVSQGNKQWTKSQTVYLDERGSMNLVFSFIEPSFWDSNPIYARTWVE